MSVAIAVGIVAFWVNQYNEGFNDFFKDADKIFRLHNRSSSIEGKDSPIITEAQYESFKKYYSGEASISRYKLHQTIASSQEYYKNTFAVAVDEDFFNIFDFEFAHDPISAKLRSNHVIITQKLSEELFGDIDPIGNTIQLEVDEGVFPFMITGVLHNLPQNSSLWFDAIVSFSAYDFFQYPKPENYDAVFFRSLRESDNTLPIENNLYATPLSELAKLEDSLNQSNFKGQISGQVNRTILTAILLILLSAFNFMNTSLASSSVRIREIGVRKVVGATRFDIFFQLFIENSIIVFVSIFFGLSLSEPFVHIYNNWWGNTQIHTNFNNFSFYIFLIALGTFISFLSCIYPALYISGFNPTHVLRRNFRFAYTWRASKFFLGGQFAITAYLTFMLTVFIQNYYFQQTFDRGYQHTDILNVKIYNLKQYLGIQSALRKQFPKAEIAGTKSAIGFDSKKQYFEVNGKEREIITFDFSYNYPRFIELKLQSGRWHNINRNEIVVNEKFVELYGNLDVVHQGFDFYKVVGVVKNFTSNSIKKGNSISPIIIKLISSDEYRYISIKATDSEISDIDKTTRLFWMRNIPTRIYQSFSQENVLNYEKIINSVLLKLNTFLSTVALLISMLGLYITVSMSIIKRSVEIGVRKAFGARARHIVRLIIKEYRYIIGTSAIVGTLIGYYAASYFLEYVFENYTPIRFWFFIIPLIVIMFVVLISVWGKIRTTAKKSPVSFLRNI